MKNKLFLITFISLLLATILFFSQYFSPAAPSQNSSIASNPSNNTTTNSKTDHDSDTIVVELPPKQDTSLKLTAIGDIMCHNSQYIDAYNPSKNTYDFSYVFEDIKEYISSADIAIGNLETTFAGSRKGYSNYPRFNTPEELATNLKDIGIDILSTANNHCMDTNYEGLVSTLNYLDAAGLSHIGTNRTPEEQNTVIIKESNHIKIAFLSFTYGTNGIAIPADKNYCVNLIDEDFMLNQINNAKKHHPDLICVSMHWGTEYQTHPNATQENLTNFLFANGVDIILGSHPHVLQPMEKRSVVLENGLVKECFVIYSFGNFMSAQTKENTRSSIILNIDIVKDGYSGKTTIQNVSYIPIYMYKATSGTKKYRILDIKKAISQYESGENKQIGAHNYSILKSEWDRIKHLMGEEI